VSAVQQTAIAHTGQTILCTVKRQNVLKSMPQTVITTLSLQTLEYTVKKMKSALLWRLPLFVHVHRISPA